MHIKVYIFEMEMSQDSFLISISPKNFRFFDKMAKITFWSNKISNRLKLLKFLENHVNTQL